MPYVRCAGCALDTYTAAAHSTIEECPGCGLPLTGALTWGRFDRVLVRRRRVSVAPDEDDGADGPRPAH